MLARLVPSPLGHSTNPSHLLLIISLIGSQASLDCDPPVDAYFIARMTGMCHHAQLISRDGGSQNFLPRLAKTKILPISAS